MQIYCYMAHSVALFSYMALQAALWVHFGYAVTWPCGYMAHSVGLQSYVACSVGLRDYAVMRLSGGYTWL